MDFNLFTADLLEKVKELLPECDAGIRHVVKANDIAYTGILIFDNEKEDDAEKKIGITIYIDDYFEKYSNGDMSLEEAANSVIRLYKTHLKDKKTINLDLSFESVKDRIIFSLLNKEKNEEYLKDTVREDYLDLTLCYRVLAREESNADITSFLLPLAAFESWNMDLSKVREAAVANMKRIFPAEIKRLKDIIRIPKEILISGVFDNFYVLTNRLANLGASALLYEEELRGIAGMVGCDLYLIPSSVHEILIVPVSSNVAPDIVQDMIKEVNTTCVNPEDFLSDTLYLYEKETGNVKVA
ncbi:MAG: hypothetical protein J6Z02_05515 [Lachnospiraceae bacterium]|nr:hypothetical protein [Lachnospiraceae bacterium]